MTLKQMEERINSLWFEGVNVQEIARTCGITASMVAFYLSKGKSISSNPNVKSRTTKAELVDRIAGVSGVDRDKLASLEKANHEALELVLTTMKSSVRSQNSLSF